ncbi:MAG: hypothetical protein WC337_03900, partial [Candidatus Muiribacteriota bacterium]
AEYVLNLYKPLTTYGRKNKNKNRIFDDINELNTYLNLIEKTMKFTQNSNEGIVEKICFHLSRIPEIDKFDKLNSAEIMLVKKFLVNYKEISRLTTPLKKIFNLNFDSVSLLKYLELSGKKTETFYISEKYDEKLKELRKNIRNIEYKISKYKTEFLSKIKKNHNIDFFMKDFVLLPNKKALQIANRNEFFVEYFDKFNMIVRPRYQEKYYKLYSQKEEFIADETMLENRVLENISNHIKDEKIKIKEYMKSIETFDTVLAKALLAIKLNLKKPVFKKNINKIKINQGIFLPLKERLDEKKNSYTPLEAEFSKNVCVIRGSNMGGKTVVLKTVSFFQLLSQMGFFIPAQYFETEIFHNFFFLGEYDGENEYDRGLSSFGKEICAVSEALKYSDKKTFYIIDEFARTTNSIEAKALTAGLMKKLTKQKNVFCIISTHLMKLPKVNNIKFYRMKGLNVEKYGNSIHTHIKQNIDESIKIINSHMDYIVLKDNGKSEIYDAVMVAKLLGADFELLEYAESMMKK